MDDGFLAKRQAQRRELPRLRAERLSDLTAYTARLFHGPFYSGFQVDEWIAVAIVCTVALFHLLEPRVQLAKATVANRWNPWTCTALLLLGLVTAALSLPEQQIFLYSQS